MRKFMMAVAALALSSGVAWGQGTATQTVSLTASVGGYCTINNSPTGTLISQPIVVTNGKASGAVLDPISITGVTCTAQPKIRLTNTKGGLTGPSLPVTPGSFVNKIHYSATVTYHDVSSTVNTSTNSNTPAASAASAAGIQTNSTITLQVNPVATNSTNLLVNGDYDDTLIITLGPNI